MFLLQFRVKFSVFSSVDYSLCEGSLKAQGLNLQGKTIGPRRRSSEALCCVRSTLQLSGYFPHTKREACETSIPIYLGVGAVWEKFLSGLHTRDIHVRS